MDKASPDKCKHRKWTILTSSGGDRNGLSKCKGCDLLLTHGERLNWDSLKTQKSVSVISAILSIIAIIVSIVALWQD